MLEKRTGQTTDAKGCSFDYVVLSDVEKRYDIEAHKMERIINSRVYTCGFLGLDADTLKKLKALVSEA